MKNIIRVFIVLHLLRIAAANLHLDHGFAKLGQQTNYLSNFVFDLLPELRVHEKTATLKLNAAA